MEWMSQSCVNINVDKVDFTLLIVQIQMGVGTDAFSPMSMLSQATSQSQFSFISDSNQFLSLMDCELITILTESHRVYRLHRDYIVRQQYTDSTNHH